MNLLHLLKLKSETLEDPTEWDFIDKLVIAPSLPEKKTETKSVFQKVFNDVIRQINAYNRLEDLKNFCERKAKDLLYGYSTVDSVQGQTLILEFKTCTELQKNGTRVVKRQRFYVHRSFIEARIKEIITNPKVANRTLENSTSERKFRVRFSLIKDKLPISVPQSVDKIVFVLPLSGRHETFLRFLNNFEDVS